MAKVKGYKATDKNGKCRNYQFKVGKTYEEKEAVLCKSGFHFCENAFDVYNYYEKDKSTRIFEVEALGKVFKEGDKSCTDKIKIVRELKTSEILDIWFRNTNSGDYNSGNSNSGYYNSGHRNSGNYNSGNSNSGYYNSGNYNSGYFNSDTPTVRLFNKQTTIKFNDPCLRILNNLKVKPILQYVESSKMTEEEKAQYPGHVTTGGFLRNTGKMNWTEFLNDPEQVKAITDLPGYDDEVFKQITGHSLLQPKTLKVTVNGQEVEIDMEKAKQLGLIK